VADSVSVAESKESSEASGGIFFPYKKIGLKNTENPYIFILKNRHRLTFNKILYIKLSGLGNSGSLSVRNLVTRKSPKVATKICAI
jgi:hypothetical protein